MQTRASFCAMRPRTICRLNSPSTCSMWRTGVANVPRARQFTAHTGRRMSLGRWDGVYARTDYSRRHAAPETRQYRYQVVLRPMQTELVNRCWTQSGRPHLANAMSQPIRAFSNRQRRHSTLDHQTPVVYDRVCSFRPTVAAVQPNHRRLLNGGNSSSMGASG